MAKALIAAAALALVLVAAVVVPLVLMPSITGFHDWPKAAQRAPRAQVVNVAAAAPAIQPVRVAVAPRPVPERKQLAQVTSPRVQTQTRTQVQVRAPVPAPVPAPVQTPAPAPAVPQAAPEAPVPPPVVDAREGHVHSPVAVAGQIQADLGLDGTNER